MDEKHSTDSATHVKEVVNVMVNGETYGLDGQCSPEKFS